MPGRLDDVPRVAPRDRAEWREWLQQHHRAERGVWVTHSRNDAHDGLVYEDLVREALCFGWIDSTARRADDGRRLLYVAPRRKGSPWARSNKQRVAELAAQGLMAPAGAAVVEQAKADGSWAALDPVDALEVPDDLAAALDASPDARRGYEQLNDSTKKQVLWHVVSAKREETRRRRIADVVKKLSVGSWP